MAAMEAANAHYHNGHHQQSGPQPPASPTLTNPDMILPDYDRSDSPDPDLGSRAHLPLTMWKNTHAASSPSNDIPAMFVDTGLGKQLVGGPYGPAGPVTPTTTPIIYGNGTMLSDIGEVTEVESTVGKPSPSRSRSATRRPDSPAPGSRTNPTRRPSPTVGAAATIKKPRHALAAKHERRSSIDSDSTITTEEQTRAFADVDDSVSVGDSVFQGDDEQSMASSYVEGTEATEPGRLGVARAENFDRLSVYSATSLSRRAEEILANAKKRLTTMEGNLTRARSSLHHSGPYGSDGSTPSPPFQRASAASYSRDNGVSALTPVVNQPPGHTRMSSDVAMRNGLPYRVSVPRSQSALGAAGGYRQPLTASKSADSIRRGMDEEPGRPAHRTGTAREAELKPLTAEELARLEEPDSASQNARIEAFLNPTFESSNSDSGTRNRTRSSLAQMQDIKEQMRDLKGKISSLREQARNDSLKRRSLQSLRTPSPFTHSRIDQWYSEPRSNRTSEIYTGGVSGRSPWNGEESSVDGDARIDELQYTDDNVEEDTTHAGLRNGMHLGQSADQSSEAEPDSLSVSGAGVDDGLDDDVSDMLTENGDAEGEHDGSFHDAEDLDYVSESGESLYHDTVQHQISHEDREDAFDYEHFFLHSAMGTMSRELARRGSTDSFTSEDSVETARGPVANETDDSDYDDGSDRPRSRRRDSGASFSTIDSFATAQERRSLKTPDAVDGGVSGYDGAYESSSRAASAQGRYRSGSTATVKRLSFPAVGSTQSLASGSTARDSDGSISPIAEEDGAARSSRRRSSVIYRPISNSAAASLHRPSVSSFDSMGTNRSFPLVNKSAHSATKKANSTGILTPRDSPDHGHDHGHDRDPEHDVNGISSKLMADMLAAANTTTTNSSNPLDGLLREDRYLVERLVTSLGRCVAGLTENGRASAESRMFRRRMDAARRALEGLDGSERE